MRQQVYHINTVHLYPVQTTLEVRTTFASRGFSLAAPSVLNSLPSGIRACNLFVIAHILSSS